MHVWMIKEQIKNTGEHIGPRSNVFKTEHAANLWVAKCGDLDYINYLIECVHVQTTDEVKELTDWNAQEPDDYNPEIG